MFIFTKKKLIKMYYSWACGVIMYTLLVGCPPFWHRKQMVMLRNIMEGKFSFTSPEWADISEDPKDLIRRCLVVDPEKRITVTEVLRHPFFNTVVSFFNFNFSFPQNFLTFSIVFLFENEILAQFFFLLLFYLFLPIIAIRTRHWNFETDTVISIT